MPCHHNVFDGWGVSYYRNKACWKS